MWLTGVLLNKLTVILTSLTVFLVSCLVKILWNENNVVSLHPRKYMLMNTPALFKEYIWLVNTIHKRRRITLDEINEQWTRTEMSGGVPFSRTTFYRHKMAIEEMFGIVIECNRNDEYRYYIANEEVLREDRVQSWILSTLSVSNIVSEGLSLQNRILLESAPFEGGYLQRIIEAMKRSVRISITYQRYGSQEPRQFEFEPYCIKLSKQRWYVLGHFRREVPGEATVDYMTVFSFDRILSLTLTNAKFSINPDFDAEQFFSEYFGVWADEKTPLERIIIRAIGQEQYYMDDLPLHHSQHLVAKGDDYTDFEFSLRPTPDFKTHLLSLGARIRILQPQWLADEISQMHREAAY